MKGCQNYLGHIPYFPKKLKTEHLSVYIFKVIFWFFGLFAIVMYLKVQIVAIAVDIPLIQTTLKYSDTLPVPDKNYAPIQSKDCDALIQNLTYGKFFSPNYEYQFYENDTDIHDVNFFIDYQGNDTLNFIVRDQELAINSYPYYFAFIYVIFQNYVPDWDITSVFSESNLSLSNYINNFTLRNDDVEPFFMKSIDFSNTYVLGKDSA
ncbi:3551_t:CDS:2, partial [Racocetra persica]